MLTVNMWKRVRAAIINVKIMSSRIQRQATTTQEYSDDPDKDQKRNLRNENHI